MRRTQCLSCVDRVKLFYYQERLNEINQEGQSSTNASTSSSSINGGSGNVEASWIESQINQIFDKQNSNHKKERMNNVNILASLETAELHLSDHFDSIIGFSPSEVNEICNKVFDGGKQLFYVKNKRNKNDAVLLFEEVFLLIAIRYKNGFHTLSAIRTLSGRDESVISKIINQGMNFLLNKFGWTIELPYINRYKYCIEE